ncbi:MAG TPA: energy transducer TonB [Pseudomonadales bacterium]|nr:energy transducer TonB [Pseudomonadales bacterium]
MTIRLSGSAILGIIATIGLFYLMQALISGIKAPDSTHKTERLVKFVRVKHKMEVHKEKHEPKQPPPPAQPPPQMQQDFNPQSAKTVGWSVKGPNTDIEPKIKGSGFTVSDGEYLPIVKVQPVYPRRAVARGMSGWVLVKFTVTPQGTVKHPVVVDHCAWARAGKTKEPCHDSPRTIFDAAAIHAARRFKYKPRVVDGQPVATAGVENRITFKMVGNG